MVTDAPIPRRERLAAAFAWIALALFYFRTLGKPSLWLDEAWEANYYIGWAPAPWLNRPVLYMAMQKGVAALFGPSELALRFLPCLAALTAVAVLWICARRELGRAEAWIAAIALALGPAFLHQAHQLKHYPFDALATTSLLAAYACWRSARTSRNAVVFAVVGIFGVTTSFTAPFVIAALALVELFSSRRDRAALVRFLGASAAPALVFVPVYLGFHAGNAREAILQDYWAEGFLPWRAPSSVPGWLTRRGIEILKDHTGTASGIAAAGVALAGIFAIPREARYLAGAFGATFLIHVVASAAGAYPLGSARLTVYLAPFLALTIGCAVATVVRPGPRLPARVLFAATLGYATFYGALSSALPYLSTGWRSEDIRELVSTIDRERLPGDLIYVYEDADPAFYFYWQRLGHSQPFPDVRPVPRSRMYPERHREHVAELAREYDRVWCLMTHAPKEEVRALREAFLERYEPLQEKFAEPDASLGLWKRRP